VADELTFTSILLLFCGQIPEVYDDLCSPRVLALEFVEGGQVNDLEYIREHK
jgi:hypothetical protein